MTKTKLLCLLSATTLLSSCNNCPVVATTSGPFFANVYMCRIGFDVCYAYGNGGIDCRFATPEIAKAMQRGDDISAVMIKGGTLEEAEKFADQEETKRSNLVKRKNH